MFAFLVHKSSRRRRAGSNNDQFVTLENVVESGGLGLNLAVCDSQAERGQRERSPHTAQA
ncbi:hypothetical protein CHELA17_60917 [Chelatococcus asaccharovorans]|nr:hypothetical protein CHELA17_60917 [Chelatococcus asaccharovorans]